jgi:homocysteine S-methyltransferase
MLGILPLRNPRHARFLDQKVSGISVPQTVQRRLEQAVDPVAEGISLSRQLLGEARKSFAGACLMPPFAHCEVVDPILKT